MTEVNPSTKGELRIFTVPGADTAKVDAARALLQAVAPAGFDVPATLRGSTQLFNAYFERGLDVDGPALADAVLAVCDRDYQTIQGFFGGVIPNRLPFNVIVGQGFGGAYHYGCDGVDLYCDSDINNIDLVRMLVVAEEVEAFSDSQNQGWNCGQTNGEGLSRVLAETLYPDESFVIASAWLDQGRPDYITANEPGQSDGDTVSNACAVLFLNWLRYQLGFSWAQITQAAAPSLAGTYQQLTGLDDAYVRFATLLQFHFPVDRPSGLNTNNPFPLADPTTA